MQRVSVRRILPMGHGLIKAGLGFLFTEYILGHVLNWLMLSVVDARLGSRLFFF
jgi:hypothetical protein